LNTKAENAQISGYRVQTVVDAMTFVEVLLRRAAQRPEQRAFISLGDGESENGSFTFQQLDRRARAIGAALQQVGGARRPVILAHPPGLEYVAALLGCFYSGSIAVPVYPPRSSRHEGRLEAIIADTAARLALTGSVLLPSARQLIDRRIGQGKLQWLATDTLPDDLAEQWRCSVASAETLALLQYTSGSTTTPKGVMVSHANLLHNQLGLLVAFQQTEQSMIVSWLPPYHDMGLIGNLLHSIYVGATCVIMPPLAFLQRPIRWLKAISRYRATTSGGPNFAYDLCVRKIDTTNYQDLDLSNWSVAFNGSEQVQLSTIERFAKTFAAYGFRREAFRPCYGLAEATLIVSLQGKDAPVKCRSLSNRELAQNRIVEEESGAESAKAVVSCGSAIAGQKAIVVNADSNIECADGEVGEIWVSGPSIAHGYWNRPHETEQAFNAYISDTREGPFLRTGDLGFMKAGELFVLGRLKELIVIRGLNHYPEDIEATVKGCHPLLEKGCGATFDVDIEGEERLVIVHEVKPQSIWNPEIVVGRIRQAVNQEHGLHAYAVMLVKLGSIPKTSSGKIQRRECRENFLNGSLELLFDGTLTDTRSDKQNSSRHHSRILCMDVKIREKALEDYLTTLITQFVSISHEQLRALNGVHQVGLDSLKSAELVAQIEDDFGISVPMGSFLQDQSIETLASQINAAIELSQKESNSGASENLPEQISAGFSHDKFSYPLSIFQERLWLISQLMPDNPALCLNQVLHFSGDLDTEALSKSINAIVERHEVLRTTINSEGGKSVQLINPTLIITLPIIDLRGLDRNGREAEGLRISRASGQRRFELSQLPLFEARLLLIDNRHSILHLTLSHFIADGWSTELFVQELATFYRVFAGGDGDLPAPLPLQYKDFSYWQHRQLQSKAAGLQLSYWQKQLADIPPELDIPTDHQRPARRRLNGAQHVLNLPSDLLIDLRRLSSCEGITLFVILLAAFKALLHRFSRQCEITVSTPVAYRNRKEFRQLIGCFANRLLLRTRLQGDWTVRELLQTVRRVTLDAFDNQDIPLSQIEELIACQGVRKATTSPASQFLFQFYRVTEDWYLPGLKLSTQGPEIQATLFDLFVVVQEVKHGLRINYLYSPDLFEHETIEQLACSYEAILRQFVNDTKITLSNLTLNEGLYARLEKPRGLGEARPIVIAGTFTAEPLANSLEFWMRQLDIPVSIEFAPYGNVFQQLLDPKSILSTNQNGVNIILVRLWDWRGRTNGSAATDDVAAINYRSIERNARDLVSALKTAVGRSASPYILGFCPACGDNEFTAINDALEKWAESELDGVHGLHLITTSKLASIYPVANPCQPYSEFLGQIPYRDEFFVALGTMLARRIYALYSLPPKLIVLDCDMTLWSGACGEEGPGGIEFDPPSLSLQQFMKSQSERGMLLSLCSKNNEEDVIRVFESRPEMILRLEDLVAWRINWKAKSENLRSLAEELQLGLASFVFIDDNPIECAEVRANCPEVLTFQLPADRSAIPSFLNHIWALDHLNKTNEDMKRTLYYQQDKQRRQALKGATNLVEFLAGLELKIKITEVTPHQLSRVAQLIHRTNQFNITGFRRSELEIKQLCQSGQYQCLGVTVEDRFGDYGLVGAVIFSLGLSSIKVDTLVISCRVLGRGVEHRVLARLGEIAREQGLEYVEVPLISTKSNRPAGDFLNGIGANFQHFSSTGILFRFPAHIAEDLRYSPETVEATLINT
jgi:FkbH-like protein